MEIMARIYKQEKVEVDEIVFLTQMKQYWVNSLIDSKYFDVRIQNGFWVGFTEESRHAGTIREATDKEINTWSAFKTLIDHCWAELS